MKSAILAILSILCSLGLGIFGSPAKAQPLDNPDLIQSFPVGVSPWELTSDGENIWVTSLVDSSMTKLRASDGQSLGTFFAGGRTIFAAFDGANIWATN